MAGAQEQQNEGGQGSELQEHDDFGGASEAEIAEARAQGWKPKADLGDDKRWVDAKTFVQRGRTFNSRLQQQVASLTEQVQAFEGTKKQVVKFYEDSLKRQKGEFDDAIAAVRRQKVEAAQNGDTDAVLALEDRLEVLHTQKKDLETEADTLKKDLEAPAKKAVEIGPDFRESQWPAPLKEWVEDGNDWFRTDPKLAAYAVALGDELRAKGEMSKDREFLDKVKEALVAEMPHKFQNGNRQRSGPASSGRGGTGGGGKSLKDLPETDRKLAEQFISEGWHTEKSFLDSYFSR